MNSRMQRLSQGFPIEVQGDARRDVLSSIAPAISTTLAAFQREDGMIGRPIERAGVVALLGSVVLAPFGCGKGSSSQNLTCSATSSGFSVALSGADVASGSIHNCTFDNVGHATRMTVTFGSGEIATCSGLQYAQGQLVRATCWTSDGKSSCVVPDSSTPDPFDPTFAWGCRGPAYDEPGFLQSCVWQGTTSMTAGAPPTMSNSAELQGGALGESSFDTASLTKMVPVKVLNPIAGVVADQAFLVRQSAAAENSQLVLPVKNEGSDPLCNLGLLGFRWLDATGAVPVALKDKYPFSGIDGSLERTTDGDLRSGCLRAGELGYLTDAAMAFSDIASVELDLGNQASPAGDVPIGLVPDSYDVGVCKDLPMYKVKVRNAGTSPVWLASGGSGGSVVAIDSNGLPVGGGGMGANHPGAVAPGETIELLGSMGHTASAARVRIFTTFSLSF